MYVGAAREVERLLRQRRATGMFTLQTGDPSWALYSAGHHFLDVRGPVRKVGAQAAMGAVRDGHHVFEVVGVGTDPESRPVSQYHSSLEWLEEIFTAFNAHPVDMPVAVAQAQDDFSRGQPIQRRAVKLPADREREQGIACEGPPQTVR